MSEQQQAQLVAQQQARVAQYRQMQQQRQQDAQRNQWMVQLQQAKRMQQYQYFNDYNRRLREQQMRYQSQQFDYNNDPYFYSAPIYIYYRGGHSYRVNQYGADLLRQAINYGYEEGYRAGRADRMDHWRFDYRGAYAYQDGDYGYSGWYMDRDEYAYYFRQGFQRGYEDGYYGRYRYGRYSNGSYSILGNILSVILQLQWNNANY
ncbi:MAG: hypothetical protein WC213_13265 [Arenimonas sp.]